jgi:protease-4
VEQIEPLAEGRVWMGAQAKSNGLVDELGGLDRAIEILRAKLKLEAGEKIRLVTYPKRKTIFEQIFGASEDSLAQIAVGRKVRAWAAELGLDGLDLKLWRNGAVMKLAPYSIRIR